MEKPVFSSDIISFCKEMGVESPEQLIGRRIYIKHLLHLKKDEEEETVENIVISKISEISFRRCVITEEDGEPRESKIAIISNPRMDENDLFIFYYLDEKKSEIIEYDNLCDAYFTYAPIEEIYIYPGSVK